MGNFFWEKFKEVGVEYLRNTNTPGYRYLKGRIATERYFWYLIHTCTLIATYLIGKYSWDNFMMDPTITTVNFFESYPSKDVAMPGISVCNIYKISKMRAEAYARQLSEKSGETQESVLQGIKLLASMDNYGLPPGEDISFRFQNLLDQYDTDANGYFNTHDRLKMLQVPCSEMLQDCSFRDEQAECDELFVSDLTMEGHCCIFNYLSQSAKNMSTLLYEKHNLCTYFAYSSYSIQGVFKRKNKFKPLMDTRGKGLTFRLNLNVSDYLATSVATTGVKILVSIPKDFPDTTSGSLLENLVGVGVEAFVRISSTVTFTAEEVRKYPIDKRGCIFPDETDTIFGGYSNSDCIMDCKIKSIAALCRCTPFNYINVLGDKAYPQCNVADLNCLSAYADKWRTMRPTGLKDEKAFAREIQNAMRCAQCVPACSDTRYTVMSECVDLFENGRKVDNFSIVHVLFDRPFVTANKEDVFFYWYDMIGLFGGLCSLMMGVSFISVVEILYSFVYVLCKKIFGKQRHLPSPNDHNN